MRYDIYIYIYMSLGFKRLKLPQQETKIKDYGTLPSIKIPIYIH